MVTLVAYQRGDVDTDLRILRAPEPAGSQRQDLRDARATLQQHAENHRLTRRGVVDHVPHSGKDRQACGVCVACNRRLQRLSLHLKEANRLAR